jgi:hypothetical protein
LVAAAAAIAAAWVWPRPATAQTQTAQTQTAQTQTAQAAAPVSGVDLLQPSLQGNPNNPPRFRRPGETAAPDNQVPPTNTFTRPSRIGATPVYGSPTGFGAGNTGFDSTNAPRRKRRAPPASTASELAPPGETTFAPVPTFTSPPPPKPPTPRKPVPPELHPARAATRLGATLPPRPDPRPVSNPPPEVHPLTAANRAGGVLVVPPPLEDADVSIAAPARTGLPYTIVPFGPPPPTAPPPSTLPLGSLPQRPLSFGEGDPYAALGIRAGSFLLFPSLDLSGAYTTNPERTPGATSSALYGIGLAELQAQSDWQRHALNVDIIGSYTQYAEELIPSLDVPYFNSKIDGRVDVTRSTQLYVENRFLLTTDNPGSPNLQGNLQAPLARLPIDTDLGGTFGVVQEFNRLSVAALGSFDRAVYDPSVLTNGEQFSNSDRNFNQPAGILRVGYDLDPGLKPFVQIQEDERIHDQPYDRNQLQRDSVGTTAQVGADVDLFGSLTGEMAGGWLYRSYKDPTLPDISGFIANGALIWQATALTTAKLTAASEVYETIVAGASGQFSHDVALEVDHAFLRWLIGTAQVGYGTDNYVGSSLNDVRYFLSAGLIYKLTREVQIRGQVRQDWQFASQPGFTYMATSFLLGLHLQR